MISGRTAEKFVFAEPFRPFRIHLAEGRTIDAVDGNLLAVGVTSLSVYGPPVDQPNGPEWWQKIPYESIESLAPMEVSAI